MVESAMRHIRILEDLDFTDIIVSLKASDVQRTVAAYRLLAEKVDYPFHLGVTEAGTAFTGTVKSSIGLGILLHEGIGDTIRVSLAAEPQEEVRVAWEIVKSLGLRTRGRKAGRASRISDHWLTDRDKSFLPKAVSRTAF